MKTAVFQFNDDGSLLAEAQIAGTGAHHCLSGAEAIVRGHDARFVTVLLSAHAAPSIDASPWYPHETLAKHSAIALYDSLTKNTLAKTLRG